MATRRGLRARNWPLVAAIIAATGCVLAYLVHGQGWTITGLDDLERKTVDLRFRARGPLPIRDNRIVVVGLDDQTRREAPDVFQTRRGWARLIRALAAQQPRAIALDLFFSSPEILLPGSLPQEVRAAAAAAAADPAPSPALVQARAALDGVVESLRGDELLAGAVADARVVYLGAAFRLIESAADRPATPPPLPAGLEKGEVSEAIGGPGAPGAFAAAASLPTIARGAAGAGAVNHFRDPDGVARRLPLVIEMGGRYVGALGLQLAALATDLPTRFVTPGEVSLGDRAIPTDGTTVRLNYLGHPFPRVSAADVLAGRVDRGALAHKILLVGYTHAAYDKVPTPYDPLTDGVELHATLLHNLLYEGVLHDAAPPIGVASVVVLGAIGVLLQLRAVRRRPWLPIVAGLLALGAWAALAQLAFERRGVVLDVVAPAATLAAVLLAATVVTVATEGREKARLRSAFAQYVSRTVVERILANPAAATLGGERRELTVLFSDIRGFSRLAEGLAPERLAEFLNQYLTPMTELVLDSDGTLDKYIGDAVMAVWNAPVDVRDHAVRACDTALAMLERLRPLNDRWRAQDLPTVQIGIGINTGPMAVGNMGSEARFDYTVLGDAVNLGARLEGLTKEYEVDVLVGEATRAAAGSGGFVFRELDYVRVKGKDQVARIYQLVGKVGACALTGDDLAAWQGMLVAYRAGNFAAAEAELRALAARHPTDGPTRVFLARVRELAAHPPGASWDGIYEQRSK